MFDSIELDLPPLLPTVGDPGLESQSSCLIWLQLAAFFFFKQLNNLNSLMLNITPDCHVLAAAALLCHRQQRA